MLSLIFELDDSGFAAEVRRLEDAVDEEMEGAIHRAVEGIARAARREHGYSNRTGRLERRTVAVPPSGRFTRDTLQAAAVGNTPYASYVEARRDLAFLGPAWEAIQPVVAQDFDASLDRACRRAGWV